MGSFVTVLVNGGRDYSDDAKDVDDRLARFIDVVGEIRSSVSVVSVETILFPAGYFCTHDRRSARALANRVARCLFETQSSCNIVWGVDACPDKKSRTRCGPTGYPFFVYVALPRLQEPLEFQQISTASAEGREIDVLKKRWAERTVLIGDSKLALLICGEVWSPHLLCKVA